MDEGTLLSTPTPIPVAVDIALPSERFPKDIDREVYAFCYGPKYADPVYLRNLEASMPPRY